MQGCSPCRIVHVHFQTQWPETIAHYWLCIWRHDHCAPELQTYETQQLSYANWLQLVYALSQAKSLSLAITSLKVLYVPYFMHSKAGARHCGFAFFRLVALSPFKSTRCCSSAPVLFASNRFSYQLWT